LKANGHYATQKELLAIIRRIDTDGDAKLSYTEFTEYLSSGSSYQLREDLAKSRSYSQERSTRQIAQTSTYHSPLRNSYTSPARASSANKTSGSRFTASYALPVRESSPLRDSHASPVKHTSTYERRHASPIKRGALPLAEEDELVRALRE
jgi:hypothetical protein